MGSSQVDLMLGLKNSVAVITRLLQAGMDRANRMEENLMARLDTLEGSMVARLEKKVLEAVARELGRKGAASTACCDGDAPVAQFDDMQHYNPVKDMTEDTADPMVVGEAQQSAHETNVELKDTTMDNGQEVQAPDGVEPGPQELEHSAICEDETPAKTMACAFCNKAFNVAEDLDACVETHRAEKKELARKRAARLKAKKINSACRKEEVVSSAEISAANTDIKKCSVRLTRVTNANIEKFNKVVSSTPGLSNNIGVHSEETSDSHATEDVGTSTPGQSKNVHVNSEETSDSHATEEIISKENSSSRKRPRSHDAIKYGPAQEKPSPKKMPFCMGYLISPNKSSQEESSSVEKELVPVVREAETPARINEKKRSNSRPAKWSKDTAAKPGCSYLAASAQSSHVAAEEGAKKLMNNSASKEAVPVTFAASSVVASSGSLSVKRLKVYTTKRRVSSAHPIFNLAKGGSEGNKNNHLSKEAVHVPKGVGNVVTISKPKVSSVSAESKQVNSVHVTVTDEPEKQKNCTRASRSSISLNESAESVRTNVVSPSHEVMSPLVVSRENESSPGSSPALSNRVPRVANVENKFKCDLCRYSTYSKDLFRRHMQAHGTDTRCSCKSRRGISQSSGVRHAITSCRSCNRKIRR